MNNKILLYAKELKKRSEVLIAAEPNSKDDRHDWDEALDRWDKLIDPRRLIELCEELVRINNLQPVGCMTRNGANNIKKYGFTHVYDGKSNKENVLLYRLDK